MDFEVTVSLNGNKEIKTFDQYEHAINFINSSIAQWNNFDSKKPIVVTVKKITSYSNTIGVSVSDETESSELLS